MNYFRGELGFTLLELLTVIAIVSILAAVSVPQYSTYKKRGFDARAVSDLRNAATAEEAYFLDNEKYLSCTDGGCAKLPGFTALSKGVQIQISARDMAFSAAAKHPQGSGRTFRWDSDRGGLQD